MDLVTMLATMPAILAIIQLLKNLFPNMGKWAALVAVVLGIALNVLDFLYGTDPLYGAISAGLLLGLGAAGVYDASTIVGKGVAYAQLEAKRTEDNDSP